MILQPKSEVENVGAALGVKLRGFGGAPGSTAELFQLFSSPNRHGLLYIVNLYNLFDKHITVGYNTSMLKYIYKLARQAAKGNRSLRNPLALMARAEHANNQFKFNRTCAQAVALMQVVQVDGATLLRTRS